MKKLLLILLCLPMIGFGQNFIKIWGENNAMEEGGNSVRQTTDGGYIVSGNRSNPQNWGDNEIFLIKTDANGIEQWSQNYSGRTGKSTLQQTTDGGYILAGSLDTNTYIIKTGVNGDTLWTKTINLSSLLPPPVSIYDVYIEGATSIKQTSDGGYIITVSVFLEQSIGNNPIIYNSFLLKIDMNGNQQWNKILSDISASSVDLTTDGGYIISASSCDYDNCFEGILLKTDANGIEQWRSIYPTVLGPYYSLGGVFQSAMQTTDGGYIISGRSSDTLINGTEMYNRLIKTDSLGITEWDKSFEGSSHRNSTDVQQTSDDGYILLGTSTWTNQSQGDIKIIKTNELGIEQWNQTFGQNNGDKGDRGYSIQQTLDDGYVLTGVFDSYDSLYGFTLGDICLIKTNNQGNITSTFNIPININRKLQKKVDLLGRETKKTNQPLLYIYDDGTVEKRIVIE